MSRIRQTTLLPLAVACFCFFAGGWPALVELGVIPCVEGGCRPAPVALIASLAVIVIGVYALTLALGAQARIRVTATAVGAIVAAWIVAVHFSG